MVFSGTVNPTDQEMTVIEKIVCDSQFPAGGAHHPLRWGWQGGKE